LVSAAIIIYLITLLDWGRAVELARNAHPLLLALAPITLLVGFVFAAFRWTMLLDWMGIQLPPSKAYRIYLKGLFYGILLPGTLGGDVVRVALAKAETKDSLPMLTSSAVLERLAGVVVLLVVGGAGGSLASALFSPAIQENVVPVFQLLGVVAALVLTLHLAFVARLPIAWSPLEGKRGLWARLREIGVRTIGPSRPRMAAFLAGTGLFQGSDIVCTFVLAQALGIGQPFVVFLFVIPVVYLATVLPISLGGLGVREGVFVFFFVSLGVATSDAIALSFAVYLNRIVVALVGEVFQLFNSGRDETRWIRAT
jgi:uncharacterized membrane protein YbhN (UPF0104 family)